MQCACIHYDAQSAADVVLGDAWPGDCDSPCVVAKLMGIYVRQRGTKLDWCHIKSHSGCPFNDFVDAAAKFVARTGQVLGGDISPLGEAMKEPYFLWIWWHDFAEGRPGVLPSFDDRGATIPLCSFQLQHDDHQAWEHIPGIPEQAMDVPHTQGGVIRLKIVTYNTLSLQSAAQRILLKHHFSTAGVHLIGLQETRRQCDQVATLGSFRTFSSEPVEGREGCQIWINLQEVTGYDSEGRPVFWNPDAKVWKPTTRLPVVLAETGGQHFALISAHAPLPPLLQSPRYNHGGMGLTGRSNSSPGGYGSFS